MEFKIEVYEWIVIDETSRTKKGRWRQKWAGESILKAIWRMWELKKTGAKCVKLEWWT